MKVLLTTTSFAKTSGMARLKEYASEIVENPYGRPLTEDEVAELVVGCDAYIAGLDYISEKSLAKADSLKVISRYGVGYDRVDLAAAKAKGITVCNTPGSNSEAVAEFALALIIALARRISYLDQATKKGEWLRTTGIELRGRTIGIVGLGAIGKNLARIVSGFPMKVLAYDPYADPSYAKANSIELCELDYLIQNSDVISLHLPLTAETKHIISREAFSKMKKSAIIINTSRGGIIDEAAAYEALVAKEIAGLGLDVYEQEPLENSPLMELDNVILSPHASAHTIEATENMARLALDNMIAVLEGKDCPYIISKGR